MSCTIAGGLPPGVRGKPWMGRSRAQCTSRSTSDELTTSRSTATDGLACNPVKPILVSGIGLALCSAFSLMVWNMELGIQSLSRHFQTFLRTTCFATDGTVLLDESSLHNALTCVTGGCPPGEESSTGLDVYFDASFAGQRLLSCVQSCFGTRKAPAPLLLFLLPQDDSLSLQTIRQSARHPKAKAAQFTIRTGYRL